MQLHFYFHTNLRDIIKGLIFLNRRGALNRRYRVFLVSTPVSKRVEWPGNDSVHPNNKKGLFIPSRVIGSGSATTP